MNKEELKKLLPHRNSMLLLDEAEAMDGVARGTVKIRGDEWFLDGHFPGNPVVPGVILCEMMGQSVCVLLAAQSEGKTPMFTGLDHVRFRRPVKPGELFCTECRITRVCGSIYFASGEGFVNGKKCVSAEFSFALTGNG
ncbi:MAG: 3-hydroxyacyl-ACP dehydratase FabZ family protein [Oscillospiraceae bacterium]|nr:3-hydroxyacyl-ACP dehydratase FabZ family protein [Oscillospiraceae bacterium]